MRAQVHVIKEWCLEAFSMDTIKQPTCVTGWLFGEYLTSTHGMAC